MFLKYFNKTASKFGTENVQKHHKERRCFGKPLKEHVIFYISTNNKQQLILTEHIKSSFFQIVHAWYEKSHTRRIAGVAYSVNLDKINHEFE